MPEVLVHGEVQTAYERSGRGPPLLLLHGGEANRQMFAGVVYYLRPNFTVLTYDQRDCGDTISPDRAARLIDLADDARDLLVGLGMSRAHVFGSSFGGRIAQVLAARHGSVVDRLILASTWPVEQSLADVSPDGARSIQALRARLPDSSSELASWFFADDFLRGRPELRDVFARVRPENDRSRRRALAVADQVPVDYGAIRSKTLLLAAEHDRVVPPAVTLAMASRFRSAERDVLPGVGHASAMEAPERLAECLRRFLVTTASQGVSDDRIS